MDKAVYTFSISDLILKTCLIILFICLQATNVFAWEGMPMPRLHVEGKYLKDPHGNIVNLHGFAQTFSPWFNERGTQWNNYDVEGCLTYNKGIIDQVLDADWKMNFVRMHMDPYWSSTPGCEGRYEGEECFDETRFVKYLDEVFVPMAEYAVSKGLYVIFRPPGVCPEEIEIGGVYHEYLLKVWGIVANHPKLKNHPNIMFELANEPIDILGPDGTYGANSQGHFDNLKTYFQEIVDTIRTQADNILWIPGLGYQSLYSGFAANPIEGEDIGYAVHVYPGWFNSGEGYEPFQRGWDEQVQPVADFAPIVVTEMDWAPEKYDSSWGTDITGTAGGEGFGANFKKIVDDAGNVSWLLFTEPHLLADFTGIPPAEGEEYTFLNDPEACPWPVYHWYQDYAPEYYPRADYQYQATADNGDGTFSNPLIYGDFSAPAVVKDGDTFYLISANSGVSPDTTVLQSKDLVNWEYSNVPIDNIPIGDVIFVDEADIHSGSLVQTETDEWWAVVSYDEGPFGQFPYLLPVSWEDDQPVVDETAKDAATLGKPNVGRDYYPTFLTTNDNFRHYKLGAQWGWNTDMDDSDWSLLERAGFMRLKTSTTSVDINDAQTLLSQRILAYREDLTRSFGTVRMEIANMKEGDVAGLSVFQDSYSFVGIKVIGGEKTLVSYIDEVMQTGPVVAGSEIYLRVLASYNSGKAYLYYSLDNESYTQLGGEITLESSDEEMPMGNRFGIFNYATSEAGGYVDVDWFSTESTFSEDKFFPENFEEYTEESLTLTDLLVGEGGNLTVLSSSTNKIEVTAVFADGHTEDISSKAEFSNYNSDVFRVANGYITSLMDGESTLEIAYKGPLGERIQLNLQVTSTTFPLTNELFNPDIWEDGTFNETTNTLQTGQWGFGGWQYGGIDLSDYKYVVVRLGSENNADVQFRLFDQSSYWGSPANFSFGDSDEVVIPLNHAIKDDETPLDPSHIYIAGFWSNGSNPFVIDTVFLSNSREYDPPTILTKTVNEEEVVELSGFSYVEGSGPSDIQSFIVSGYHLTDDVLINSPTGFEVSMEENDGFTESLTITQTDGEVAETNIYVRMKSGLTDGYHSGDLVLTSSGAYDESIALSGSVEKAAVTGIGDIPDSNAKVLSSQYFTLTGQEIRAIDDLRGFFIVRKIMSDGTVQTSKIFKGFIPR